LKKYNLGFVEVRRGLDSTDAKYANKSSTCSSFQESDKFALYKLLDFKMKLALTLKDINKKLLLQSIVSDVVDEY